MYISKKMASGLYITKNNIKHDRTNKTAFQKTLRRSLSTIFNVLKELGISQKYGQNTVKINIDKLKEFSLSDIMGYVIKNPEN